MAATLGKQEFSAMRMVAPSRWTSRIGWLMLAIFIVTPFILIFIPWQQNIRGKGRVVALNPQERPQNVDATIGGRITEVKVQEGSVVKKGDLLLKIVDLDPEFRMRLESEKANIEGQIRSYEQQQSNILSQIESNKLARDSAIAAADSEIDAALEKVRSSEEKLRGAQAKRSAAELQYTRKVNLNKVGAASDRMVEVADRDLKTAEAEVNSANANLEADKDEVEAKKSKRTKITQDFQAKIDELDSKISEIGAKIDGAREKLAKKEGEIRKAQSQDIIAPVDGTVFRVSANLGGQIVKSGDQLLVIVPETQSRVVEMWVDGNDAPLISKGDLVRIQFEGWPAVQFAGWPSVAIGTFPGHVEFIDATDNGQGQFRIIVTSNAGNEYDEEWPDTTFLRQGVQAKGWVLLREVKLGYEIWRQLNGFPPAKSADKPPIGGIEKPKK